MDRDVFYFLMFNNKLEKNLQLDKYFASAKV